MDVVIFTWIITIPKSLSPDAFARPRICQNASVAGASPWTCWRSSQRSPETPSWIRGRRVGEVNGRAGMGSEGKREGKAGPRRGRAPETAYSP